MSIDWTAAKARTDVIVPWVTFVALLCGGVYSLFEYTDRQRERRIETTLSYVLRLTTLPVSDFRLQLSRGWDKHEAEILDVLERTDIDTKAKTRLYNDQVLAFVEQEGLNTAVQEMLVFFNEIGQCVKLDLCDQLAANAMLVPHGSEFFRQYFPYICALRTRWRDRSAGADLESLIYPESAARDRCAEAAATDGSEGKPASNP